MFDHSFREDIYTIKTRLRRMESTSSMMLSESTWLMVQRAIANAARHGINLCHGRANAATGNCALEAPVYNVNDRKCFNENFDKPITYYRRLWMSEGEKIFFESPFNPGYSDSQWKDGFKKLKQSNIYKVDFFEDLIIPSVACGIKKRILIFNTNIDSPREPVTVINPCEYGVQPTSEIPIVLGYNLDHYESLHPVNRIDERKCTDLVNKILAGGYEFTYKDLKGLVDLADMPPLQCGKKWEVQSSLTKSNQKTKKTDDKTSPKRNARINVRQMSDEERRKYKREMYQKNKEKKTYDDLLKLRNTWKKNKASLRMKKRVEDEQSFKVSIALEKESTRMKKRTEDEQSFKDDIAQEKARERMKRRTKDEKSFKANIAQEKQAERVKKRTEDEQTFKVNVALEKASTRMKKRTEDVKFFKATRAQEKQAERVKKEQKANSLLKIILPSKKEGQE